MTIYNFYGQRADKVKITDVNAADEVQRGDGMRRSGFAKDVEHYTVTCGECDGIGRYDELGDIVCEDCGLILSGSRNAVLPVDYSGSRGFDANKDEGVPGHEEPS